MISTDFSQSWFDATAFYAMKFLLSTEITFLTFLKEERLEMKSGNFSDV